ncbi:hypothetical protein FZC84_00810 [Rossellomorea vietnamensis]|uniref:Uncharacterized protein n=1 Tax=Rossellomorea vietnamensis TaxID=218284 RepID=A0A5D4MHD2_9BACI|nr:hypothetical protein [Rossellomorea vietnamensis]TYS01240.1 hypothetical protein FZC84_00810 [Rossellomorea vietnamensis]
MNNTSERGTAINIRSASFFKQFRIRFTLQNRLQKAVHFHLQKRLQICFFSLSTERVSSNDSGGINIFNRRRDRYTAIEHIVEQIDYELKKSIVGSKIRSSL